MLEQELNNGEVDLEQVQTMCFKFADGSVTDDTGDPQFRLHG